MINSNKSENICRTKETIFIYEFLNTDYKNQTEYYNAFYKLTENNALIMAENNNISTFSIYTARKF